MRVYNEQLFTSQAFLTTTNSTAAELEHMGLFAVFANWTDSTPANKTFVDANVNTTTDRVTITSHGYVTGVKVTLTSTGTLPAGLATSTPYWLIVIDANTIKFAASYANAIAGTPAVDITAAAGGGTHTVAVTALAGGTVKLQSTLDDISDPTVTPDWRDIGSSSVNITATGSTEWYAADVAYRAVRLQATLTAGYVTISARINAKGF